MNGKLQTDKLFLGARAGFPLYLWRFSNLFDGQRMPLQSLAQYIDAHPDPHRKEPNNLDVNFNSMRVRDSSSRRPYAFNNSLFSVVSFRSGL